MYLNRSKLQRLHRKLFKIEFHFNNFQEKITRCNKDNNQTQFTFYVISL